METVHTPKSSNIASFAFDGKLLVKFKSGEVWEYNAPRRVFDEMKKAKSAGEFFYAKVRSRFKGERVNGNDPFDNEYGAIGED